MSKHRLYIILGIILNSIILNNCSLTPDAIKTQYFKGYVLDNKTEFPLENVTVFLIEVTGRLKTTILAETQTDKNGYYKFILERTESEQQGQNYAIGLPDYEDSGMPRLKTYGIINVNGNEYNYTESPFGLRIHEPNNNEDINFRLRPTSYFKVHIKNINPIDSNDIINFKPYDKPWIQMQGTNVDTTLIMRRWYKECEHPIGWNFEKGNGRTSRTKKQCCPDGDTCLTEIFY